MMIGLVSGRSLGVSTENGGGGDNSGRERNSGGSDVVKTMVY